MDVKEKIERFKENFPDVNKKYAVEDFYQWHHNLTGSCEMGRKAFASSHNIDIDNDMMSVAEFTDLTENAYGGKELSTALQPFTSTVDGVVHISVDGENLIKQAFLKNDRKQVDGSFTPPEDSAVVFLRRQVERLQAELEKEREHNREKDKQLLETLNKLAESQAALSAGQAADKQKALAEKIIEGRQQLSDEESGAAAPQSFFKKIFGRKKY